MSEEIIVHTVQDLCVAKFHSFLCDFPGPWLSFGSLSVCWSSVIVIWTKFPSGFDCLASIHDYKDVQGRHQHWNCILFFIHISQVMVSGRADLTLYIYSSLLNGWTENAVPLFRICTDTGINQCLYVHPKKEGKKKSSSLTLVGCISLSIFCHFISWIFFFLSSSTPRC